MNTTRQTVFMKLLLMTLLSILIVFPVLSQKSSFDSLYSATTKNLTQTEPEQSLKDVDYLFDIADNDSEKIRAMILKAGFLTYYGLNDEAYVIFLEAEKLAKKNEDFTSLTRIYGYISSIHREAELYSSGLKYLEKASVASGMIDSKDKSLRLKANLEQEKANIQMEKEDHKASIKHARKSINYLSQIASDSLIDRNYHLVISNGIIFRNYLSLNEIDSSFYYLDKAQENFNKSKAADPTMQGQIFNGLGQTNSLIKNYDKAEEYFLKAKKIADETNFFNLKQEVYESLSEFYKEIGQSEKFITTNEQYLDMIHQDEKSREQVADKLLNSLYAQQQVSEESVQNKSKIILYLTILSIILGAVLTWYIYNKRQNKKKFQAYILNLNNKPKQAKVKIVESENSKSYISEEKEKSILESLRKLEESDFFLDENISLTSLSSKVGVNQRYLTYVIKQHLASDFASYINELRINYIVNCIKTDPKYLLYKISYLAEQCGFASHSRFSINFKKVTGTTPSAFINYVRKENEKESSKTD